MNYFFIIGICCCCAFIIYFSCCCVASVRVNAANIYFPMLLLAIGMASLAFCLKPTDLSADLNRHFFSYENLSGENGAIVKKVTLAQNVGTGLFAWLGVIFLSIKLGSPHFIPLIMVFINYLFFAKTMRFFARKVKITFTILFVFLIVKVGLVSWFHEFSGLRNTTAFAILTYALFLGFDDWKKNKKVIIFFELLAVFIHPSSWIVALLFFLQRVIRHKKILYFILMVWSFFSLLVAKLLTIIPLSSIKYIATKITKYYGFGADRALEWRIYLVSLVFVIIMFFHLIFIKKNKVHKSNFEKKYNEYIFLICCFLIGSFYIPTMLMRFTYLLGFMFLPLLVQSFRDSRKDMNSFFVLSEVFLCSLMCAYNYVALTSHMYL